jgi:hypothetical protein
MKGSKIMNASSKTTAEILAQCGIKNPSPLFQEAFREQSNREMEWLWYAEWVPNETERRYCLQRALYINPNSRAARKGLDVLQRKQSTQPKHALSLGRLLRKGIDVTVFGLLRRPHHLASE